MEQASGFVIQAELRSTAWGGLHSWPWKGSAGIRASELDTSSHGRTGACTVAWSV